MLESARILLEIFAAWLGSARILFETELLKNARLGFQIPCSKSPSIYKFIEHYLYVKINRFNSLILYLSFIYGYYVKWLTTNETLGKGLAIP